MTGHTEQRTGIRLRLAQKLFNMMGWRERDALIRHVHRSYEELTYRRLQDLGMQATTIIDVGAYHADWSRMIRSIFPDAHIHMVEAQPDLAPQIEAAASAIGNATAHNAVLSHSEGESVSFHIMGTGSSLRRERSNVDADTVNLTTTTLDSLLPGPLPRPLFLKLDTQGAELDVLQGGINLLAQADYIQLETAFQNYNEGAPLVAEVLAFLSAQGFLATEISGFSRPKDHLVQADILFAREGDILRPSHFDFG